MTNYANDFKNLQSFTGTYTLPSKKECEEEIIYCLCKYVKRKWYQQKKPLLLRAMHYADILNNNYDK